jgi:ABC-type sugar transport system permease subunit
LVAVTATDLSRVQILIKNNPQLDNKVRAGELYGNAVNVCADYTYALFGLLKGSALSVITFVCVLLISFFYIKVFKVNMDKRA